MPAKMEGRKPKKNFPQPLYHKLFGIDLDGINHKIVRAMLIVKTFNIVLLWPSIPIFAPTKHTIHNAMPAPTGRNTTSSP